MVYEIWNLYNKIKTKINLVGFGVMKMYESSLSGFFKFLYVFIYFCVY